MEIMKMVRLHQFGGPQHLSIDEVTPRKLEKGEARIKVYASSITGDQLSFINGRQQEGEFFATAELPATLGYEASGVVIEVGEDVDTTWIGKQVAPIGPYNDLIYGSLGEEAIVPANRLIEYPERLESEEAAAIWVPYLTAYPIYKIGNLKEGEYIAILAATSTVGHAAIQIAHDIGAIPIATTRSQQKAYELMRKTGIKHVIVTETENYVERVMEITDKKGTKVAFDPIGGPFLHQVAEGMAIGGTIIEYGVMGGFETPLPVAQLIGKGLKIQGYAVSEVSENDRVRVEAVNYILDRLRNGIFKPTVAATFPLADIHAAYQQLVKNDKQGRIVIKF